jgi:lipid II:glycine glycyltransferase (peptidoglycan interpeptide bridge formation enzyme)
LGNGLESSYHIRSDSLCGVAPNARAGSVTKTIWEVEVDRVDSDGWSELLEQFDDANVYQTAAYGEVRWGRKNLSRFVLKRNGEVAGIAQLRLIRPTPLKCGIAYLRWGPLWESHRHPFDAETPVRLAQAIEDEYLKKRKLFVRILPNAFAGSTRADVFQAAFSQFAFESPESSESYRTFVVDLAPSLDELRKKLDPKWRNKLKQAERNDLTVISGTGTDLYQTFCEMYSQMRRRKEFETTVDVEEFGRIQNALSDAQRMHVLICQDKGIPVAGIVVSAMGNSAIYLLGATSDAGLNARGAYLLQWSVIQHLKEKGIRFYDLGGIDPVKNLGVYQFKRGLSGADVCQIMPLAASSSALSAAMVKVALGMQRTLRASRKPFNLRRALRRPAEIS